MDRLLQKLQILAPDIFPSTDRYDYSIHNSHPEVLPKVRGGKPTQPLKSSVDALANIERLKLELRGCTRIVFMGERAGWAHDKLQDCFFFADRGTSTTKHPSNRGINSVKVILEVEELKGTGLKEERLQLMAEAIVDGLRS